MLNYNGGCRSCIRTNDHRNRGPNIFKTEKGTIVLIPAGIKAILTVLTDPEAQLGLIFFEMETRAVQVEEILSEI